MTRGIFLFLLCLLPQIASAEGVSLKIFGHQLEVYSKSQDDENVLMVDKKELLKNAHIDVGEVGLLANTGFAIGTTSAGGNMCDETLFVLSFVQGAPARIDGPLDSCRPLKYRVERDRIVVEEPAAPGFDGSRWTWTNNGFSPPETVKFTVARGKGWNALRSRSIQHPSDLLGHEEFVVQFAKLLGQSRYSSLPPIITGPGSIRYEGDVFIGQACQAHSCDDTSVLTAIDIASQKVAVALKDGGNPPFVSPQDADWPAAAKNQLSKWRANWREQE